MTPFKAMQLRHPISPDVYGGLVMASGPRQYLRLAEISGTGVADASGFNVTGTYRRDASSTTTPGLLTGNQNRAYLGPAASSTPVSGMSTGVAADTANNFTVTAVIRPDGVPPSSGFGCLLQLGASGFGAPEIGVLDQGGGLFKLRVGRSAVATLFTSTSSWAYGTRLHVKLSRNTGNVIALRVNGAAQGSTTFSFATFNTVTNIGLYGSTGPDSFQFYGAIDEFAVWNSFVSDATTDAQYAAI